MMSSGITASRRGPVPHPLREKRDALRVDHQAVRLGVRGRHRHQLDLAGGWSQPANHVPLLHGEPERALLVEDRRVRTTRRWIGDLVFGDHAIGGWSAHADGLGILYLVTTPVLGSSFPRCPSCWPVYQMYPSLSATSPCGPTPYGSFVLSGRSG